MNQMEACDILFPAVCGDLTLLLENVTRFDAVFFDVLERLPHEAQQIADPVDKKKALESIEALKKLIHDPKLLSLTLINKLFTSNDHDARRRLCLNNAVFMDEKFFELWRSEVTDHFEKEREGLKLLHSRSRYNEVLAFVIEILPERAPIPCYSQEAQSLEDSKFSSVLLIGELIKSDDYNRRMKLCEKHANSMDDDFFLQWQNDVISVYDKEQNISMKKRVRSRYNEALCFVKHKYPNRQNINMVEIFNQSNVSPQNIFGSSKQPFSIPGEEFDGFGTLTAKDYVKLKLDLLEFKRTFPVVTQNNFRDFSSLGNEIAREIGIDELSDDTVKKILNYMGPSFSTYSQPDNDYHNLNLMLYKSLMPAKRRNKVSNVKAISMPIGDINAASIRLPDGEAVILINIGIQNMLWALNCSVMSIISERGDAVIKKAGEKHAQVVKRIIQGRKTENISKTALEVLSGRRNVKPFEEHMVKSFMILQEFQELFIIGHELEHICSGHLENAECAKVNMGKSDYDADLFLKTREAEFEADENALEVLLSRVYDKIVNPMVAVSIFFQYMDLWEDISCKMLPHFPDHPTAEERRLALVNAWKEKFKLEDMFYSTVTMAFLSSVKKSLNID